jgi:anti-anti-sigma factor
MEHREDVRSLREGDRVEVVTRFSDSWVGGFEVAATAPGGCHLRRVSDGEVLPALFDYQDVRPSLPISGDGNEGGGGRRRAVADVVHTASSGGVVLRLPPDLDIATVEAIRDSVMAVVDDARGEIVVDLDSVRFLDTYGIRLLVTLRRRAWERDTPVVLRGGKPLVRALLELVGIDPSFHPEGTVSAAKRSRSARQEVLVARRAVY